MSSFKKRRVQSSFGGSTCEDETDCEPPEWRMELKRNGSGENVSPGAMDTNGSKEKCCHEGDCKGKTDGKSGTIK